MKRKGKSKLTLVTVCFGLYMAALITMVLLKYGLQTGHGSLNLIPFQWANYPPKTLFDNVFGNIAFFIPFGLFLPLLSRRFNTTMIIIAGFLLSLFFEAFQYVTDTGGADIDDLILNTCGVFCGALLFLLLKKLARDELQLQRNGLISIILIGGTASAIFLFA